MSEPARVRLRRILRCVCVLAFVVIGCGPGQDRVGSTSSTLTILHPGDEGVFSPGWPAQFLVFLPLVARNASGALEGRLAQRWEHSPDYRQWTIHLRTDVRWHDGVPVTAHDVEFTLDLLSRPEVGYQSPDALSVRVLDDSTYTISYQRRAGGSPLDDWTAYYPKHLLEDLDPERFWQWEFWTRPVGNGPYRFVRHLPKTMIELEANPYFYAGKPQIDRVILKAGHGYGEESSLVELLSGNVDAIPYVHPMDLLKVEADPRFRVYHSVDTENLTAIAWNQDYEPFKDARARRALTLAIDRRELLGLLNLPDDLPVADVLYSRQQFQDGELPEPLPYDRERSSALLEQAGWRDVDGDGVRERNGEAFAFTAIVSDWQQAPRAAVFVQEQLRRVGVQMELQVLDLQVQRQRVRAGEFEAAIILTSPGNAPLSHRVMFGESSPIGYTDRRVITLLDSAQAALAPDQYDRIYRQLGSILQADLPLTILYPSVWATVANRRVGGLSSPYRADPVWYAEHLWLEEER